MTLAEDSYFNLPHETLQDLQNAGAKMHGGKCYRKYLELLKTDNSVLYNILIDKVLNVDNAVLFLKNRLHFCKMCGKPTKHTYCSNECAHKDMKTIVQHRIESTMLKYGVANVSQVQDIKNKIKETFIRNYGTDNPNKTEAVRNKIKQTKLAKYGDENYANLEKAKQTNLERYGYENPNQNKSVREKTKLTCQNKYGGNAPYCADSVKQKGLETNLEKYGTKYAPQEHLKNLDKLSKETLESFADKDCFNFTKCREYFNASQTWVLRRLHDFHLERYIQTAHSVPETDLFDWIPTENKIHNDRTVIKPYEIDILLPDVKLGIEYNGTYWHSTERMNKNYHLEKLKLCLNSNIQLYNIFDFDNLEIWKSMISNKLGLNQKIYARKCIIKELKHCDVSEFLKENHLQGDCKSKINLGLFYKNELVQVMTFSKPRYNKKYEYELIRLCTKKYTNIIGGSSKLFKYFIRTYSPKSIISYANRRFSQGKIYEVLGFKYLNETAPNYWYSNSISVLSRIQCQKHKLCKLLSEYDENLTEVQNMKNNGYYQIFDCGNLVYTWNKELGL